MATPPPPGRTPAEQNQPDLLEKLLLRVFLTIPKAFTLPFAVLTRHHVGGAYYGVGTLLCQVKVDELAGPVPSLIQNPVHVAWKECAATRLI